MKSKILIVEDESIEAMNFQQFLESFGYDVVGISSTGEDAIKKAAELEPDLVLMDIILKGDMDGIEAAFTINDMDIPVVYLSAHSEENTIKRAKLTYPYGFVNKPINKRDLKNIVELALYKHQMEKKLNESEKKFKAAFDNAPVGMVLTSPEGKFLSNNKAFVDLLGYGEDELTDLDYSAIIHPKYLRACKNAVKSLISGMDKKLNLESRFIHKDGHTICADVRMVLFRDDKTKPLFLITHIQDITERKTEEEKIRKNQRDLVNAQRIGKIGSFHYDFAKNIEKWSDGLYEILNIDSGKEMTYEKLFDFIIPEDHHIMNQQREKLFKDYKPVSLEFRVIDGKGNVKYVSSNVELVLDNKNVPLELIGTVQDITERKSFEKALNESKTRLENLYNNAPIGIFHSSPEGKFYEVNKTLADILGYESPEELISTVNKVGIKEKLYVNHENHPQFVSEVLKDGMWHSYENRYFRKDGSIITAELSFRSVHNPDGSVKFLEGFVKDITKRKEAEEEITKSLEEKELLISEIHHRVKNNLQIISSLLNLQEESVMEDSAAISVLKESQNRVINMAMIHELLYQSKDLSHINFSDYIENLVSNLTLSYGQTTVIPKINVKEVFLNIETAIPCGLIINELVSNSLKHAFPPKKTGELSITLEPIPDKEYKLIISDNGIGIPPKFDFRHPDSSLGLKLVNTLVHQIDGAIELDRTSGTKFTIKFKEQQYKKRKL